MEPKLGDKTENLSKISMLVEKTMREYPKTGLIIFPELITTGYECGKSFFELAEVAGKGESFDLILGLAKKYGVGIIFGFPERNKNISDVLYNSAAFAGADGKMIGVYRKVHLFAAEKSIFRPGFGYPVFNTRFGRIGIMICWDTAFPEVARIYALGGAEIIAVSTNWEKPYSDDWDLITRARAFDNTVYLAAANRIGFDKTLGFFGRSKIIGPLGKPIRELNDEKEGIIAAGIDLTLPRKLRREYYTFFKDRRPDTYSVLTGQSL